MDLSQTLLLQNKFIMNQGWTQWHHKFNLASYNVKTSGGEHQTPKQSISFLDRVFP